MMNPNNAILLAASSIDSQLFLAQVLAHANEQGKITQQEGEKLYQEITTIAHKLITMKITELSDMSALRLQIQNAFTLTSLGVEYGSQANFDKAIRLLLRNRIVQFFQIGNTLTDKLVARAHKIMAEGGRLSPVVLPGDDTEDFQIYNQAEQDFLKEIPQYRINIHAPQITIRETIPLQKLARLTDVTLVDKQLTYLENRAHYVAVLPIENIFKPNFSFNDTIFNDTMNPVEFVSIGLMANLILHRQLDFKLDDDTLADFTEIVYTDGEISPPIRQRLLDWIAQYLEKSEQSEAVRAYAIAYWDECLTAYAQITKHQFR